MTAGRVYPGRMFRDLHDDYDAFFAYGIGAMCWSTDAEGRRELWFIAPAPDRPRGFETARVYVRRAPNDWAQPGDVDAWDGNEERPTLTPSIWLRDRQGWHGFIHAGNLVTA